MLLNQYKQDKESLPALAPGCVCKAGPPHLSVILIFNRTIRKILLLCKTIFPGSIHPLHLGSYRADNLDKIKTNVFPNFGPLRSQMNVWFSAVKKGKLTHFFLTPDILLLDHWRTTPSPGGLILKQTKKQKYEEKKENMFVKTKYLIICIHFCCHKLVLTLGFL